MKQQKCCIFTVATRWQRRWQRGGNAVATRWQRGVGRDSPAPRGHCIPENTFGQRPFERGNTPAMATVEGRNICALVSWVKFGARAIRDVGQHMVRVHRLLNKHGCSSVPPHPPGFNVEEA